ncbi:hypothetical protein BKA70DRAFT_1558683 [Coprinopsis sp. MPI-PUGE-AT-0042]|nr:hypothetical protein BKA70DRAFT_1558683 [Coprinopsis sp. MPI-PUGE-AT-0042]
MIELPAEIWALVAIFLEDWTLHYARGVNRALYYLSLDRKYQAATLNLRDPAGMDLACRPLAAPRIRHLTIAMWSFNPFHVYPASRAMRKTQAPFSSLQGRLKRLLAKQPKPEVVNAESSLRKLGNVLPLMRRVDNLDLTIRNNPVSVVATEEILITAWSVFGSNLHQLSLRIGDGDWEAFVQSNPSLPSLRTLEVELIAEAPKNGVFKGRNGYLKGVAAFMNSVSAKIQTLKLQSSYGYPLAFATLFSHLQPFPLLHSLLLHIPFTGDLEESPSGLTNFLLRSLHTLKNADIRIWPLFTCAPCQAWLSDITSNPIYLSHLRSLDIQAWNIEVYLQCISNSYAHLQSLTIPKHVLPASAVLDLSPSLSMCQQLYFLQLQVEALSSVIFNALARDLPGLHCLCLSDAEIRFRDQGPAENYIDQFCDEMQTGQYPDWKLQDLTLWEGQHVNYLYRRAMSACSRAIPSLRSLGQGAKYKTRF